MRFLLYNFSLICQEGLVEENEDDSDYDLNETTRNMASAYKTHKILRLRSNKMTKDKGTKTKAQSTKMKSPMYSPTVYSPIGSPNTISSPEPSPKLDALRKQEPSSRLRLKSRRVTDSNVVASLPASPRIVNDYSISSVESDGEVIVRLKICLI